MSAQVITILETATQRLSPAVKLGCGNFWEEQQGVTAGLWVMHGDTRAAEHMRVHAGQQVKVPGFQLKVLEVTQGQGEGALGTLRVEVEPAAR